MAVRRGEEVKASDLVVVIISLATIAYMLRVQFGNGAPAPGANEFEPAVTSAGLDQLWRDAVKAKESFTAPPKAPKPAVEAAPAAAPEAKEPEPPAEEEESSPRDPPAPREYAPPPRFQKTHYSFWGLEEKAATKAFENRAGAKDKDKK